MAFHTFLGWYTANEYKNYKDSLVTRVKKSNPPSYDDGKTIEVNGHHIMSDSTLSLDPDDVISSEEYEYPKAKKLNTFCNIFFTVSLTAFNVVYWSVAMGVYFSEL